MLKKPEDLFSLKFQALSASLSQYPKAVTTEITLDKVIFVENIHKGSLFPTLIRAKRFTNERRSEPFFCIKYEHKPLDKRADDVLAIKMLPLEIVLNPVCFRQIYDFFSTEKEELEAISALQAVAQDAFQGVKSQTRASLENAIEEHQIFKLNLEVDAPIFLVPSNFKDENEPILVINAGHLQVKSDTITPDMKAAIQAQFSTQKTDLEQYLYDSYNLNLTSTQVSCI